MRRLKAIIGQKLCDLGLWILSLGPKDMEDKQMYRELILMWKHFEGMKK